MTHATMTGDRVLTTPRDAELAQEVLADLRGPEGALAVERPGQRAVELPPEVGRILQTVLDAIAAGRSVTITTVPEDLTTVAAARMLGISRPTLMKKIAAGELPSHKVGTHTRLKSVDVLDYAKARLANQRAAFNELRELLDGD